VISESVSDGMFGVFTDSSPLMGTAASSVKAFKLGAGAEIGVCPFIINRVTNERVKTDARTNDRVRFINYLLVGFAYLFTSG
jgi:nitrate reductase gamma subunit